MNVELNLDSGFDYYARWNGDTVEVGSGAFNTELTLSEAKVIATVLNEIVRTKENN